MHADVRIGDVTTEELEVCNGLRQECVLAPSLFNIYLSTVVGFWRKSCLDVGIIAHYKFGRKLAGDRTAKNHLNRVKITQSQFADDVAVCAV